jgi:hypothetical protein
MKFELNEKELKNFQQVKDDHLIKHRKEGSWRFIFTPTGIGYTIRVENIDTPVPHPYDITDYDSW